MLRLSYTLLLPQVHTTAIQCEEVVNPWFTCVMRVTVVAVCVCVCVSVKSRFTSGVSVCCENAAMYSAGDEGQTICGVFSETAQFWRSSTPSLGLPYIRSAIFPADNTHVHCAYASSLRFAM